MYMRDTNSGHSHERELYSVEDFEEAVRDPRTIVLTSMDAFGATGFALAYQLPKWIYLDILCVRPSYRGHGIGRALIQKLATFGDCIQTCYYTNDYKTPQFLEKFDADFDKIPTIWATITVQR